MPDTATYHAMYTSDVPERPLPTLPSPTLTNPDMVLPDLGHNELTVLPSPPRRLWEQLPPSPSYTKSATSDNGSAGRASASSGSSATLTFKREKLGLMSRKMTLLRSRSESASKLLLAREKAQQNSAMGVAEPTGVAIAEPPVYPLSHIGLSPNSQGPVDGDNRASWASSTHSNELEGMPEFLARYRQNELSAGEESESDHTAILATSYPDSVCESLDERRRQQREDEQASLLLSRRAEVILANAKKRLNLMEGNLRGARDLVAPLTAANLKRAASLGSGGAYRGHYGGYGFRYDASGQQPLRSLQSQASSPTMLRDYQVGHWRGFSESEVPERPITSLEHIDHHDPMTPHVLGPSHHHSTSRPLRGTKSYECLEGGSSARWPTSREPLYIRGSPDPALNRVDEDETPLDFGFNQSTTHVDQQMLDRGTHSPSPRPDDLRDQMTSLKGRISSLKQRAQEDSLRRKSLQTLREPSPLNNATTDAPGFYHSTSLTQSDNLHTAENGLVDTYSIDSPHRLWQRNSSERSGNERDGASRERHVSRREDLDETKQDTTGLPQDGDVECERSAHYRSSTATSADEQHHSEEHETSSDHTRRKRSSLESEQSVSVYEDAPDHHSAVVAHEDREDAFDYEHFFLHSAMRMHGSSGDEGGDSRSVSSHGSDSSALTARGDALEGAHTEATGETEDEDYDDATGDEAVDDLLPSSTSEPETPEKLRQIERKLHHRRAQSIESVSTFATFATADEGFGEEVYDDKRFVPALPSMQVNNAVQRSKPSSRFTSPPTTNSAIRETPKQNSLEHKLLASPSRKFQDGDHRPTVAIPSTSQPPRSDSSSERADSGVGLSPQPQNADLSSINPSRSKSRGISPLILSKPSMSTLSPPMSPSAMFTQDPATVIVNTLLASSARNLGLKDKALLFGVVEGLRKTVLEMQQNDVQRSPDSKPPRKRLEEAKMVLEGVHGSRQ